MNDVNSLYELWLSKTKPGEEIHNELLSIEGSESEITDRFYRNLEFGTGGLRGVLGAGTNRMNVYTVGQATQGLASYLLARYGEASVAIGYDSRINSDVFAHYSARILAANGIKVWLYPCLIPTPMVSFAVLYYKCQSGIVITASHNPSKYNGYKCYDEGGYQMTDEAAAETLGYISKTDIFDDVKIMDFNTAVEEKKIEYIPQSVMDEYYELCSLRSIRPDVIKESDIKIIYSPLNGTGNIPVRTVLDKVGFKSVKVVKTQELPDGSFPTCPFPNPEIKQVFEQAFGMTSEYDADLILATDPDCDRGGIAVKCGGEYRLLNGNDVGVLLTDYILSARKNSGTLPDGSVIIKSFVSSKLADKVASKYGCKCIDTLTGFKYIGEIIADMTEKGCQNRFMLGFEESYGYLVGAHARDKDAVASSMLICEMAAYYKKEGLSLVDVLEGIYREFGYYTTPLFNFTFEGADGMVKMINIMEDARLAPPENLGGEKVLAVRDYKTGIISDTVSGKTKPTGLPVSNVLAYELENDNFAIVRPSGTEPKIKVYVTATGKSASHAAEKAGKIAEDMKKLLKV
ncbi:MAG: phospho-sugar mutase [Clostridiales bacterium]|nr:phospho-sugar mutase [Clostridiales bacterium]